MIRIITDKIQFSAISNRQTALIFTAQPCGDHPGKYAVVAPADNISDFIIAYIYQSKSFSDYEEVINDTIFKTRIDDEMKDNLSETAKNMLAAGENIYALWLYTYDIPKESGPALVPATLIMYHCIQLIRHLHIKRKLFRDTVSEETEKEFFNAVSILEKTVALIKCEFFKDEYITFMKAVGADSEYAPLTDLLNEFPELSEPNEFRKNLLGEISDTILRIKKTFEAKDYKTVRKLAYDIHNLPEMIRTMNDWRKTPSKEL